MKYKLDFNTVDYSKLKISELKRIADYWLRQYLLKLTKRNGLNQIYCPIKKKFYSEDKMQVAHFIDRNKNSTRYSLENCNLVSSQSNMWDAKTPHEGYKSKHHKEYEDWLGSEKVQKLLDKSKDTLIFARQDYVELIEKFKK